MQPVVAGRSLSLQKEAGTMNSPAQTRIEGSEPDSSAELDRAAVRRVLAGDNAAFEEIVRRWQGPIINMAWRYTRDRGRAEELAQEVFLRAWRNLASWRGDAKFSSWLFTLAANLFRTELKRYPTVTAPIESIPEPADASHLEEELLTVSEQDSVRRAVLALPMRYREPVLLFYFHEMDLTETARTLKIPEGTLKARLSRGREILRRRFPALERTGSAPSMANLNEEVAR
jgi:RNA polymerase sigma-70 factor (ECF subfamily)